MVVRDAGPVQQAGLAVLAVTIDPFAGALPGDPRLHGDMRDRTNLAPLDQTATAFHGQRGITVEHRTGLSVGRMSWWYFLILPPKDPSLVSGPPAVTNVTTPQQQV